MHFWEIFEEKNVIVDLQAETKEEAIDGLLQTLVQSKSIAKKDLKKLSKLFLEREERGSTGIGCGVAIPHVKYSGLDHFVGAVGIHGAGLDYKSIDGDPVHIVLLSVRPEESGDDHLDFLKWMSKLARHSDFRSFARHAKSPKEVISLLKEMASI